MVLPVCFLEKERKDVRFGGWGGFWSNLMKRNHDQNIVNIENVGFILLLLFILSFGGFFN